MTETALNMFDLIVLTVIGLSALLSFFRGFLREVFSLAGWLAASVVTLRFLKPAATYVRPHVSSEVVASGIASVGLFFITLILISIVTGMILKFLKPAARIGLFDNLVGLCFGVARGVLIVALGYFIMTIVLAEKNYPKWIKESYSRPYVAQVARFIGDLTPQYLDKLTKEPTDGDLGEAAKQSVNEMLKKIDKTREGAVSTVDEVTDDIDEEARKIPTIEDLQKRIKEENERR
jgi:membrane protein required for colicin V production